MSRRSLLPRRIFPGTAALAVLALLGFGGWIASLPAGKAVARPPPVPQAETDAMLAMLEPKGANRPLVAVIGLNDATETTDYFVPPAFCGAPMSPMS